MGSFDLFRVTPKIAVQHHRLRRRAIVTRVERCNGVVERVVELTVHAPPQTTQLRRPRIGGLVQGFAPLDHVEQKGLAWLGGTGLRITAVEVDAAELETLVEDYATTLSRTSGRTARTTKSIINMIRSGTAQDTEETRKMFLDAFRSADFREGYQAFLEKRTPDFPDSEPS